MPWDQYWTIIFQVVIAIAVLVLPVSVAVLALRAAFTSGKSDTQRKGFRKVSGDE